MSTLQVREVDYLDPRQAAELVDLLDAYARDSAGVAWTTERYFP